MSKLDLDKEIAKARREQRSSRGTARSNAIKKLSYLQAAKRLGIHPKEWVWTKVPVIPPQYRPISSLGDNKATIVADVNYLYKELLDAVQVFRDKQKYFGEADNERMLIYQAMRAVAGLGQPTHPKNRERRVKGLLEYVFGSRPKTGAVQARLISGPVDLVARGVIAPSEDMDIDHVGLPENMAWQIYKPFVVRRLVQSGMSRIGALQEVEKRSPRARQALVAETQVRPVIINRAPTLHRYGMMAAWPKLIDGHVIKVNNMTLAGFGGDFDGDTMQVHVPASEEAVEEAINKMMPSRNLLATANFRAHYVPRHEFLGGLYLATAKRKKGVKPAIFNTVQDALRAYARGEVSIDTPVRILQPVGV